MRRSRAVHIPVLLAAVIISVATTSARSALADEASSPPADSEHVEPPLWRDWAITGSGVALFLSGIAWQVQASGDFVEFDRQYAVRCPLGCVDAQLPAELSSLLRQAQNRKLLAVGSYTLGPILAATGTYYLYRRSGSSDRLLPNRKPMAMLGGGAGALVLGGVLQALASRNFADYDEQFQLRCGLSGCVDDTIPDLQSQLSNARLQRNAAFASYAVGGAAVVAGVVLAFRDRRAKEGRAHSFAPTITPIIGPRVATLNLQGAF